MFIFSVLWFILWGQKWEGTHTWCTFYWKIFFGFIVFDRRLNSFWNPIDCQRTKGNTDSEKIEGHGNRINCLSLAAFFLDFVISFCCRSLIAAVNQCWCCLFFGWSEFVFYLIGCSFFVGIFFVHSKIFSLMSSLWWAKRDLISTFVPISSFPSIRSFVHSSVQWHAVLFEIYQSMNCEWKMHVKANFYQWFLWNKYDDGIFLSLSLSPLWKEEKTHSIILLICYSRIRLFKRRKKN